MVGRTPPGAHSGAEANRFLLRTERMLAESGESGVSRLSPDALNAERTPHSARSFRLLQNVGKMYTDCLAERGGFEPPKPFRVYTLSRRAP
jgi:hypothetical protein